MRSGCEDPHYDVRGNGPSLEGGRSRDVNGNTDRESTTDEGKKQTHRQTHTHRQHRQRSERRDREMERKSGEEEGRHSLFGSFSLCQRRPQVCYCSCRTFLRAKASREKREDKSKQNCALVSLTLQKRFDCCSFSSLSGWSHLPHRSETEAYGLSVCC